MKRLPRRSAFFYFKAIAILCFWRENPLPPFTTFYPAPNVPYYLIAKSSKESPTMKKLLIAAVALLPLALTAQTKHVKLTNDGAFASISTSDSLSKFQLQVSRGTSNGSSTTNLVFVSSPFPPIKPPPQFLRLWAQSPTAHSPEITLEHLTLNLDPSTLDPTATTIESCTLDFTQVDPIFMCGALPPGTIHMDFQENDLQANQLVQTQTSVLGPITIHQPSKIGVRVGQCARFGLWYIHFKFECQRGHKPLVLN